VDPAVVVDAARGLSAAMTDLDLRDFLADPKAVRAEVQKFQFREQDKSW